VEEQGSRITINTEKEMEHSKVDIDVAGLDRTTILYYIQALYRIGVDEVRIVFKEPTTVHFRGDKKVNVISVIHREVNRLVGYEIIQQKEDFCIIKDLSKSSIQEFDSVLRRIFLLMNDASSDLLKGAKEMNKPLIETIEEKHNSITKFISYCLRLLNKYGYSNHKKTSTYYHILATYDRVVDVLKNAGRDMLGLNSNLDKKTIKILELIDDSIKMYGNLFYKFDPNKVVEIYKTRDTILNMLKNSQNKIPVSELRILSLAQHILELVVDMSVARMGFEN